MKEKRNEFIVGGDPDSEESEIEGTYHLQKYPVHNYLFLSPEDGDSGFSPSPTKTCPDTTDSSLVSSSSSPQEVPRMASRHNVISRKDNIILSPDCPDDSQSKDCDLSPNSMALRLIEYKSVSFPIFSFSGLLEDIINILL